ncbi:MAG: hypothetical protein AAF329_01070 [Cyanobacteria bacterium P01_A01_bin.17]
MRWAATPIANLLSEADREEWLGDLREQRHELTAKKQHELTAKKQHREWVVNAIILGEIVRRV